MSTDNRDYLDRTRSYAQKVTGSSREAADEMMPRQFAVYGLRKRAAILDSIDASMTGDLEEEEARGALEKVELRRQLGEIHEQLRKAGR
jgi:hypothetical protein